MLLTFDKGELLTIEAHVSQVSFNSAMRELSYKLGAGLRCIPMGDKTSVTADIDISEEDCWAIVALIPIFYSVAGIPCGYTAKMKVYEALARFNADSEVGLGDMPDAPSGDRTYKEVLDANNRKSNEDDTDDNPNGCTRTIS